MEQSFLKKRQAIIETLSFFDIFDFALTKDELCDYMLYKKWKVSELDDFINHEEFIIQSENHVFLRGRAITLPVRIAKEHLARKLIKKTQKFVKYMQMLPFVRMIAICNSLSYFDAQKNTDIDLFIVTEKNRLFLARMFVWMFTHLLRIRRHGTKVAGRFCLSFFVTTENLDIQSIKYDKDIYLAFWLRLMRPIIGQEIYRDFIKCNKWIKEYFSYPIDNQNFIIKKSGILSFFQKTFEFPLKGRIGNYFERLLRKWQMKRALNKAEKLESKDGIIVKENMLKFHDVDMRNIYTSLWKKRINQYCSYMVPTPSDFEIQRESQSLQTHIPFEFHSPDAADMKNEKPLHR